MGVVDLPGFYRDMEAERDGDPDFKSATRDVRAILDDFKRQGVNVVVLDLRGNGGGFLNEAVSLTGLFISDGPVVQVKAGDSHAESLEIDDPDVAWSGPLLVLISKLSASASEIVAGAIQDYGRGLIVGDHSTHGKGTVQRVLDLGEMIFRGIDDPPAMGELRITTQQFYRPDGDSTQERGVLADVELPWLTSHLDVGESDLPYALPFDQVAPLQHQHLGHISAGLCDQLRRLSEERVKNTEKFQKVVRDIARYEQQKGRNRQPQRGEVPQGTGGTQCRR